MSALAKLMRGSATVGAGTIASAGLSFARNIIIARMLATDEFGLAMTFALTAVFFEMISHLGFDKLLVQSKQGDEPRFQAAGQAVNAMRGIGMAIVLFLLAGPIARYWDAPEATWAFQCLALVPLLRGLEHLDVRRFQRILRFAPLMWTEVIPQVAITIAAFPLLWWKQDYSAVLYIVVAQAFLQTSLSHLLAERAYRWAWDRDSVMAYFKFGWPLIVNGLLMYATLQGDQVIVGGAYDLAILGLYAVAFTLSFQPSLILSKMWTTTLLPWLAESHDAHEQFHRRYRIAGFGLAAATILWTTLLVLLAHWLINVCYGERYVAASGLLMVLAVRQGIRLLRVAPTLAQLAYADTQGAMIASAWRTISLVPMIYLAYQGVDVIWVAAMGILGETLAYIIAVIRLNRRQQLTWHIDATIMVIFTIICGGALLIRI